MTHHPPEPSPLLRRVRPGGCRASRGPSPSPRRPRRLGITVVEMSLGLALTAIVAAAVAAAMTGTSAVWHASDDVAGGTRDDYRTVLRLQNVVARSKLIGAVHTGSLTPASGAAAAVLLWTHDANADGQIQLLEVALIEHATASASLNLSRVQYPAAWSADTIAANNPTLTYADISGTTAIAAFKARSYLAPVTVVRDMTGLRWTATAPAGGNQQPSLEYAMVLLRDGTPRTVYGTATLRSVDARPAS